MNPAIESIYQNSPIAIQNIMISLFGAAVHVRRYSGKYPLHLKRLMESQWFSREQLDALAERSFKSLFSHANNNVEYYRRTYRDCGIEAGQDISLKDLSKLPIIDKTTLRLDSEKFVSGQFRRKSLIKTNTSGSTGTPLSIYSTKEAVQRNYAFFSRFLSWAGVGAKDKSATCAGRVFIPLEQVGPPYWRNNYVRHNMLFSSYHISDVTLPYYIEKLHEFQPQYIDSYPSAIYALALYLLQNRGEGYIKPKAIITSSETLMEYQRKTVEQAFQCAVYDQYGSAEMVAFISQCEKGTYHVNPEYGIIELVDDNGALVPPGEEGSLLCTGFVNPAMPLIRYRIGDRAVAKVGSCGCGRAFPEIEMILGREDDYILTQDGRRIGRLDPIYKGASSIRESQIVQEEDSKVSVLIVRGEGYAESTGERILTELRNRVGVSTPIEIKYVEEIRRSSAGKFRSVVSYMKSPVKGS